MSDDPCGHSDSGPDPNPGRDDHLPLTGVLNGPGDWDLWYFKLKNWAQGLCIWEYIDLDLDEDPKEMPVPEKPQRPAQNGDKPPDGAAVRLLSVLQKQYRWERKEYAQHVKRMQMVTRHLVTR